MERKKLSIITVCYNAEDSIRATIESVLSQTFTDFEYIIIDGGSKDRTLDIIREYEDRLSAVISEPDNGIYDAMNKGIRIATGEWINFRNSGDRFLSDTSLEDFFKDEISPDVGILHGDCVFINDWGYKLEKPDPDMQSYKKGMPVLHPASFVKSEVHKKRLFDTSFKSSGDYDFIFHCCEDGIRFEYRPIPIVLFPVGGYAMTNIRMTVLEDCRIRGIRSKTRILLKCSIISFKAAIIRFCDRNRYPGLIMKRRMKRKGWKEFPISI